MKKSNRKETFGRHATAPLRTCLLLALALMSQSRLATAAQTPVALGRAGNFAVLAGSTVTSTGASVVNGDLGVSPGTAVTGFPPGVILGTLHAGDAAAANAQLDLTIAYNDAAGRSTAPVILAGNLGGLTLTPGLYKSSTSLEISSGDLTLDAQGDSSAVFIFQMGSTFVTTSGRQVVLSGGARAGNIFWQVGSSATIGTSSVMKGNILADQSISLQTGATLQGRALARIAAVTLDSNRISGTAAVSNNPPVGALGISCAFTLTNGNAYVIALNGASACVVLDGSGSSNADHTPLDFGWLVDGTNVGSGAIITNCLALGCHSVLLAIGDGQGGLTEIKTNLCVITASEAIEQLIAQVKAADLCAKKNGHGHNGLGDSRSLLQTLTTAAVAFDAGRFDAGMDHLQAFEHKAHVDLGRTYPAVAALFIESARKILEAVECSAGMIINGVGCHDGGDQDEHHRGNAGDHHGEGDSHHH
jgi:hypothetical protein